MFYVIRIRVADLLKVPVIVNDQVCVKQPGETDDFLTWVKFEVDLFRNHSEVKFSDIVIIPGKYFLEIELRQFWLTLMRKNGE